MLNNEYTMYLSGRNNNDLPYYVKNVALSNKLLFEDKKLNISIYEMTDLSFIDLTAYTVFYSINDFESPVQYWHKNLISEHIKHGGEKSDKIIEYSSTFEYPLDSLHLEDNDKLVINCSLFCYFESKTNSQIVISFESDNDTYIWRSFEIDKYKKAYSNWWNVKCETEINANELKNNSTLKIYVWNENKKVGYIDDFEIRLMKISD